MKRAGYRWRGVECWRVFTVAASALLLAAPGLAQSVAPPQQAGPEFVCPMMEAAAQANALPVEFFARLIWLESHFQPDAVGPLTRGGAHALGIAQFMPETAVEQQLFEPFDPKQALPKSGAFLAELRDEFGNLGLAAAAYNAGPQRVRDFLAGARPLPEETRAYVLAVTGHPVEDWTKPGLAGMLTEGAAAVGGLPANCRGLVASLQRWSRSVSGDWRRADLAANVPSWCRGLSHPNAAICGPVHAAEPARRAALLQTRNQLRLLRSVRLVR